MTTAADIVQRAYRTSGLVRVGNTPTPEESTEGLEFLNELLEDWAANQGIDLGLYDLESADEVSDRSVARTAVATKARLGIQEMDTDMAYDDSLTKTRFSIVDDR